MTARNSPRGKAAFAEWQTASLILLSSLILNVGCSANSGASSSLPPPTNPAPAISAAPRGPRPVINSRSSPEALAGRFLELLAAEDREGVRSLRVTRDEFCKYVWPELASSRVPNVTCEFAWDQATLNSNAGFNEIWPSHKGKRYEIVSLEFLKGVDAYPTYKVHKKPLLLVKDENGARKEVRFFGSMLELDGQYKLFSFVND
jgi:hypothetical protein